MYQKWLKPDGLTDNPHITGFIVIQHSPCLWCKYRKENYKDISKLPTINSCVDCYDLPNREVPNFCASPVWEDGYRPTKKDHKKACFLFDNIDKLVKK